MSSDYMTASEGRASGHEQGYSELSGSPCATDSASPSRPSSALGHAVPKRSRVRFNSTSEANDSTNTRSQFPLRDRSESPPSASSLLALPKKSKASPAHSRNNSVTRLQRHTPESEKTNPFDDPLPSPVLRPRPSVLRKESVNSYNGDDVPDEAEEHNEKAFSALAAQERAQRIASLVGSHSAPASRRTSIDSEVDDDYEPPEKRTGLPVRIDDIPLINIDRQRTDGAGYDVDDELLEEREPTAATSSSLAHKLVRAHTTKYLNPKGVRMADPAPTGLVSGQVTPTEDQRDIEEYVPRPTHYRGGVLSSLLKLYNAPQNGGYGKMDSRSGTMSGSPSQAGTQLTTPGSSGTATPSRQKQAKWYNHKNQSQDTLAGLIEASAILGAQGGHAKPQRPGMGKRTHSGKLLDQAINRLNTRPRLEDEIRITVHIAETLSRHKYILKLCRALMSYGAPTHRLEEYMTMTARVLEVDGQFLYIPGCMIISFDDASTHTTEVKLVKSVQGVDLGKLKDVHEIYKEVVHDVIGVEEATQRLDAVITKKPKNNPWVLVLVYGFASATVGPFAFEARLIDMPIAWILGCLLGTLQLIVAPRSNLYSNVFEISAAVLTSFLARAFGSIRGGDLFCFSALAQSSIALILPGYMVLCGSLELQSKSMVAGSVRMVYAIIYSLFLGFGITIGTALYGLFDPHATTATTCPNPITGLYKWPFVPLFTLSLTIINQAKWKQTPVMLFISFAGYIVNYYSAIRFPSSAQLSNTLGAFAVGVLGNLYSRVRHGVAAAALLPAIFVQVPSGLAASGSLLAGLSSAESITNSTSNGTSHINGTSSVTVTTSEDLNTIVFNVGYSMIQVAIGITVGLFLSALVVYPLGKRRSGLFSF
ncbi:putative PRM10 [Coleophoma crateriformis]|uniref:Putative PRM10 n=1 Tax=Coleophoma crateriformis TaxID=565419 RepID=A0A3D8S958_9HELO|nr:putative PRM10 [Coleophoma crateriformis]